MEETKCYVINKVTLTRPSDVYNEEKVYVDALRTNHDQFLILFGSG